MTAPAHRPATAHRGTAAHRETAAVRRATPATRTPLLVAMLCSALSIASLSCKDNGGDPPPGPRPSSLSFVLDGSTEISFSGEGAWPASGSGVIARMDSSGKTLQIAAYTQTAGKTGGAAGPEPRFTMLFLEISDPAGISAGPHIPSVALFARDLPRHQFDSLGYFGISGSVILTGVSRERVAGSFSEAMMRPADSATASLTNGAFDAACGAGLLTFADTGSSGGSIPIAIDTGTTPTYSWSGGPVYAVSVARASALNALVWGIVTIGGDSIQTGVKHGLVPAGAARMSNLEPALTPGVAYRVTIGRVGGAYGYREFVP